jgi:hypothetical protein
MVKQRKTFRKGRFLQDVGAPLDVDVQDEPAYWVHGSRAESKQDTALSFHGPLVQNRPRKGSGRHKVASNLAGPSNSGQPRMDASTRSRHTSVVPRWIETSVDGRHRAGRFFICRRSRRGRGWWDLLSGTPRLQGFERPPDLGNGSASFGSAFCTFQWGASGAGETHTCRAPSQWIWIGLFLRPGPLPVRLKGRNHRKAPWGS